MTSKKENAQLLEQPDVLPRKVNSVTNDTFILNFLRRVVKAVLPGMLLVAFLMAFWLGLALMELFYKAHPIIFMLLAFAALFYITGQELFTWRRWHR